MNTLRPIWKNLIFLVSAPSGAGKTTLCDKLQKEFKALLGDLYEPLMEIRQTMKDSSRMQARMLDDVRVK